jgi:spore coat protein U-like protein
MSVRSASSAFALGLLASGLALRPVLAATPTASFAVSAIVQATCLVSASTLTLDSYRGAVVNTTSMVSVDCTNSTPYSVGLSVGQGNGSTRATREMSDASTALWGYGLISNAQGISSRRQNANADPRVKGDNNSAQMLSVHDQLSVWQHFLAGELPDTMTVTVTY